MKQREEILHNEDNEKMMYKFKNKECYMQQHGPFLFLNDISDEYSNSCESRKFYRCACLKCGRIGTFKMNVSDRRKTIYTNKTIGLEILQDYYDLRNELLELINNNSLKTEIKIQEINERYKVKKELKKIKR